MTNYANQPYGQQMPAPHSPQPHSAQQTYKVMRRYDLVYMGVRGGYLILILVLLVFLTSMLSEQGIKGPAAESRNEMMAILIVVFLAWLVYTGAGGWLATKGNIAGVYMGVVDVVIVAIL